MSAIFTNSSGPAGALAIQIAGAFIAWGHGDPAWDSVFVQPQSTETDLVDETGRRAAIIEFCTPDDAGLIIVNDGRFTHSDTPTRHIHVYSSFDYADAVGETIREAAIFIGTQLQPGLPGGQTYFQPGDVLENGQLLMLDRFVAFERTIDFHNVLRYVITL